MSRPTICVTGPFPVALAGALKAAKMSQSELARRVGCGRGSICAYLHGRDTPRRERLAKINEALGADLSIVRPISAKEVAQAMGMGAHTLRRDMRRGYMLDIGKVIPSPSGKRCSYRFYPAEVKRLIGLD